MDENCNGCFYHATTTNSCDYIFIRGCRRPCPPGAACTVRVERREAVKSRAMFDTKRAYSLWLEGMSYSRIAKEVGTTAGSISYYARKHWVKDPP